jgi:glycosyltransferase involved in cell wall biosynthesis
MNIAVVSEVRFCRVPDGSVWADASPYQFWTRYLDEFNLVTVVAREERIDGPRPGMQRADGPGVRLRGVPHYLGSREFMLRWRGVRSAVRPLVYEPDALILRLGSLLALGLQGTLLRSGKPYGVEVVGDPWDTFAPGVVDTPMRSLIRRILTRSQQRLCASAAGAAYVTEKSLQQRYPCSRDEWAVSDVELEERSSFTTHYSSIELSYSDFATRPRVLPAAGPLKVVTVGSLAQRYKGVDVLIRAVSALNVLGRPCGLTVIGDGRYRAELEALAASLDLPVRFTSHLKRSQVMSELDDANLFVLASRTEGLPRAVIEAMAQGLPCIGTRVGGIPELLDSRALCEPGSVESLVDCLLAIMSGRVDGNALAVQNLKKAHEFRADVLRARRREFYRRVRLVTEEWQQARVAA